MKKKHKKHKKDKKNKKQKHSSPHPPIVDRFLPVAGPSTLELPDSLSSNSMSLFTANTSDSIKDQQQYQHQQQQQQQHFLSNSMGTSLPSTSLNTMATKTALTVPAPKGALWTTSPKSNAVHTNDLTFTGKFTKTDDNIISIDSSSGSNSPKYRAQSPILIAAMSRSSSPSRLNLLPMRSAEYGSRVATDEENSTSQHISMLQQQTESSLTNPFGESSMQVSCWNLSIEVFE